MRLFFRVLFNLTLFVSFFVISYVFTVSSDLKNSFRSPNILSGRFRNVSEILPSALALNELEEVSNVCHYNLWCVFTKVTSLNEPLAAKLKNFMLSLSKSNSTHLLQLHVISDSKSKSIASVVFEDVLKISGKEINIKFYNATEISERIQDIVSAMRPHFSSQPNSYYGDSLFFISLGLHLVAPKNMSKAAMFDVDLEFRSDIINLFEEFDRFGPEALFGLAPELTPVYRHILYRYRNLHKDTHFGKSLIEGGYPGLNSGVILFELDRIRESNLYNVLLEKNSTDFLAKKYSFKGHLGDQDFYTVLGMEHPELIKILPCGWNRQLCDWWKNHGYKDIFAQFATCNTSTYLYHGNCNSLIPRD